MFSVAAEFDYREVILAQLEAVLAPLADSRRGVLLDSASVEITCSIPSDFGDVTARLVIAQEVE